MRDVGRHDDHLPGHHPVVGAAMVMSAAPSTTCTKAS